MIARIANEAVTVLSLVQLHVFSPINVCNSHHFIATLHAILNTMQPRAQITAFTPVA